MTQLEVLKNGIYSLFKDFEPGSVELYEALNSLKYYRIPKGTSLFLKGDSDRREAYLILEGKVAICTGKKNGVLGPRRNLLLHHKELQELENSFTHSSTTSKKRKVKQEKL
jgi:hypothetical protein